MEKGVGSGPENEKDFQLAENAKERKKCRVLFPEVSKLISFFELKCSFIVQPTPEMIFGLD